MRKVSVSVLVLVLVLDQYQWNWPCNYLVHPYYQVTLLCCRHNLFPFPPFFSQFVRSFPTHWSVVHWTILSHCFCANNLHEKCFQTADLAPLFSHRIWVSQCKKVTFCYSVWGLIWPHFRTVNKRTNQSDEHCFFGLYSLLVQAATQRWCCALPWLIKPRLGKETSSTTCQIPLRHLFRLASLITQCHPQSEDKYIY